MYRIHDMRSIALLCDESIDSYKNKIKMYKMTVYESIVHEKYMNNTLYEREKYMTNICK